MCIRDRCTPIPPRGKSSATSQRRTIRADYQTGAFSQQIMRWWDRRRGKELCSIDRVSMIRSRWWDRVRGKELLGYEIPQFNKHRKVYRRHHLFSITLPSTFERRQDRLISAIGTLNTLPPFKPCWLHQRIPRHPPVSQMLHPGAAHKTQQHPQLAAKESLRPQST